MKVIFDRIFWFGKRLPKKGTWIVRSNTCLVIITCYRHKFGDEKNDWQDGIRLCIAGLFHSLDSEGRRVHEEARRILTVLSAGQEPDWSIDFGKEEKLKKESAMGAQ